MPSHAEMGSDVVSIVVADGTRIHTQLLADALRNDRGLQVVAAASNSEELLAAITRVLVDVVVISHNLDDQLGHGTQVLREMRALRPHIKGVVLFVLPRGHEPLLSELSKKPEWTNATAIPVVLSKQRFEC